MKAPCPLCGEAVTVGEVYDEDGCTSCGASLTKMQEASNGS